MKKDREGNEVVVGEQRGTKEQEKQQSNARLQKTNTLFVERNSEDKATEMKEKHWLVCLCVCVCVCA
jgi:hypothetical protein